MYLFLLNRYGNTGHGRGETPEGGKRTHSVFVARFWYLAGFFLLQEWKGRWGQLVVWRISVLEVVENSCGCLSDGVLWLKILLLFFYVKFKFRTSFGPENGVLKNS